MAAPAVSPTVHRMTERDVARRWNKHASVPVEAAAELVNVDTATIRRWSDSGFVEIEWRGDMEVVRLDTVEALAASQRQRGNETTDGLRARLEGATVPELSVIDLQELVRDRD